MEPTDSRSTRQILEEILTGAKQRQDALLLSGKITIQDVADVYPLLTEASKKLGKSAEEIAMASVIAMRIMAVFEETGMPYDMRLLTCLIAAGGSATAILGLELDTDIVA